MSQTGRVLAGTAVMTALLAAPAGPAAPAGEEVTRWRAGRWTIWRIDRPVVDRAPTEYAEIRLDPGDRVLIDAGGCLRRSDGAWAPYGGGGEAVVSVAGATDGFVPLRSVLRQPLAVAGEGGPLRLGFRAASLRGSGYDGARSGACSGQPDAYVYVGVESAAVTYAPMDLVWSAGDRNGIPLDPKWGQQANVPGSVPDPVAICFSVPGWFQNPVCTTQRPSYDTATWFKGLICEIGSTTPLAGHVNWYPSTYEGPIYWSGHSWSDDDYNINLVPIDKNGLVVSSGGTLHTEFDAGETVDNFITPWWRSFRDAVDAGDSVARGMLDGRKAIVSGLAGLDCEHDCYTEVHPTWLLAIRVRQDALKDVWAIFARNWGNEGYCSRYQHYLLLSGNQYKVSLPWRTGATGVGLGTGTQFYANTSGLGWSWGTTPGQKVNVTFQLPAPDVRGRIHGELVLNWTGTAVAAAEPLAEAAAAALPGTEERGNEGEALVSALIRDLTPEQRTVFERGLARPLARPDRAPMRLEGKDTGAEALAASSPGVRAVVDHERMAADRRVLRALRDAYGGRLPGVVGEALRGQEHRLDEEEPPKR